MTRRITTWIMTLLMVSTAAVTAHALTPADSEVVIRPEAQFVRQMGSIHRCGHYLYVTDATPLIPRPGLSGPRIYEGAVRRLDVASGAWTTVMGGLDMPWGITTDAQCEPAYIAEILAKRVIRADGTAVATGLDTPREMVPFGAGVAIAISGNNSLIASSVLAVVPGSPSALILGLGKWGGVTVLDTGHPLPATSITVRTPSSLATGGDGCLYVVESGANRIVRVCDGMAQLLAGSGDGYYGTSRDGAVGREQALTQVRYVAMDATGANMLVYEEGSSTIWAVRDVVSLGASAVWTALVKDWPDGASITADDRYVYGAERSTQIVRRWQLPWYVPPTPTAAPIGTPASDSAACIAAREIGSQAAVLVGELCD